MRFCWITLHVNDLRESLEFYQEIVGLEIDRRFEAGGGREIAFLGDGETKVELVDDKNLEKVNTGKDISLGFEVNSLSEKMDFVKDKGITIHSGPFEPNPNLRFFFIQDPNGLKIQFVENKV
ncbi:MAG: VOC family protein [Bacillota bacterium]